MGARRPGIPEQDLVEQERSPASVRSGPTQAKFDAEGEATMQMELTVPHAETRTSDWTGDVAVLRGRELTPREWSVLQLESEGMSEAEIAEELGLNCLTVRVFGSNALMKLSAARALAAG